MAEYNEKGEEIPDKRPVAMPLGYERPEPLEVMVARMVRVASNHSAAIGNETLEEANDFGEEQEDDLEGSPYQFKTMEEEYLDEKPRTNPKGHAVGTGGNKKDTGEDSREVSDTTEAGNDKHRRDRRAEDKARTEQQRERRQTANRQTDRGQGRNPE